MKKNLQQTVFFRFVVSFCSVSHGQSNKINPPFSSNVLHSIPADDSHVLYFATKWLNTEYADQLNDEQLKKARKLSQFFGKSIRVGPRPREVSTSDFMQRKRNTLYDKFSDRSVLLNEMTRVAKRFSGPEGRAAAVHILDLVLEIDPTLVAVAYEKEKLFVTNQLMPNWDGTMESYSGARGRRAQSKSRSGDLMMEVTSGIYEVDFSKLGASSHGSTSSFGGLVKNQSLIKGLLVQELSGAQFAGKASQMNATVLGKSASSEMTVRFNQKVGSMMTDAIDYMLEFLKYRHGGLPQGIEVELSFEEQYIPKDGPSAGVACALMIDALLKGHEFSPAFAVTGAMDEKGIVGGVGGVDGKIRGAISRNCEVIAIPSDNEAVIQDLLILEGPATLSKIQIVEIETFDQALGIAKRHEDRDPDVKKAIETFREIQKVLNTPNGRHYLRNVKVQAKFRSILKVLPNHLSAKYLLLKGMGREPNGLTLMGSVQAIDRKAAPLINALREGDFDVQDRLGKDSFADTISALTRLRPFLDERTRPCSDAIIKFSGYVRTAINSPPRSPNAISELRNNIRTSGRSVGQEYNNLFDREDVKAELLIEDDDES